MEQEKYVDGYQKLATAIVIQAIDDFRKALRHLVKGKGNIDLDIREINDVIHFVNSKWFATLTNVQREIILNKLKEEVKQSGINKILGDGRFNEFFKQTFQN